jgi:hypothetical protein
VLDRHLPIGDNQRCVLVHPSYPSGHLIAAKQGGFI